MGNIHVKLFEIRISGSEEKRLTDGRTTDEQTNGRTTDGERSQKLTLSLRRAKKQRGSY